ncbi:MAG TPA: helix-turn-helix domain-containing protein [Steroidobacteraceae bacterium]|nr:helix-turn-helix domain-containing protein [Steroidobacteraceae bacterium]
MRSASDFRRVRAVMAYASSHLDEDLSLAALSAYAALSPFRLHRLFSAVARETTKEFTSRLRLERAAAILATDSMPVLGVALTCGFRSHETFTRLFRRRFGLTPTAYRRRGLAAGRRSEMAAGHAKLIRDIGPCLRLYQTSAMTPSGGPAMKYEVSERTLTPQPVLVTRRRINRADIAKVLGGLFGTVFLHAQRVGATLAGQPFTRYLDWGPGLVSIEAGLPVATRVEGAGDVLAELLPGGRAAFTTHRGPYEQLVDAHAAVQQWIEEKGHHPTGSPWEVYVTDPADEPDPMKWRTDVFWPIGR